MGRVREPVRIPKMAKSSISMADIIDGQVAALGQW